MNAILVSVDYTDLLRLTLPANRHHFNRVLVVTSPNDHPNVEPVASASRAEVYATEAFYEDGAVFNKWKALEQGLDVLGREGWICVLDADVLWPKCLAFWSEGEAGKLYLDYGSLDGQAVTYSAGQLISPLRRMFPRVPERPEDLPAEEKWPDYPIHRNVGEWAGYSQIFHAADPVLGPAPWHEVNWRHAGGADSFFQMKWGPRNKVRPPFEVLHLGPAGTNWCGRVSEYAGGKAVPEAEAAPRKAALRAIGRSRREHRGDYNNPTEKLL